MNDYIQQALRTESFSNLLLNRKQFRLLHSAMGLSTESGEFLDSMKKALFYGSDMDRVNLLEELGDICWYMAIALHELNSSFEEVQAMNLSKLKLRYPSKFEQDKALNRDLSAERADLELKSYTQAVTE